MKKWWTTNRCLTSAVFSYRHIKETTQAPGHPVIFEKDNFKSRHQENTYSSRINDAESLTTPL